MNAQEAEYLQLQEKGLTDVQKIATTGMYIQSTDVILKFQYSLRA